MHAVEPTEVRVWILLNVHVIMRQDSPEELALFLGHRFDHVLAVVRKEKEIAALGVAVELDVIVHTPHAGCILLMVYTEHSTEVVEYLGSIGLRGRSRYRSRGRDMHR